ncbi:MAG: HTTM domain-containing protein [Saprospiraceae bacterium]
MSSPQHISIATDNGRNDFWQRLEGITPLVVFRILFGLVVAFGAVRFMTEGWIETLLVEPDFFFSFWGFGWIPRPNRIVAYALYGLITASAVAVSLGYRYRWSLAILLFSFTYAELLDATNYLNHYYLVVLLTILMLFTPAHRAFSMDVRSGRVKQQLKVPKWHRHVLMLQLALVYIFAGLAKVDSDWLLEAMPMAIWLPERAHYPIVGQLLKQPWVAFVLSWAGCLYDLTIVAFLLWRPTRKWAYAAVIVFHMMTWSLFNIGLFPLIMMTSTLLFFNPKEQQDFLNRIRYRLLSWRYRGEMFLEEVVLWNSHPELRAAGIWSSAGVWNTQHIEENSNMKPDQGQVPVLCSEHVTVAKPSKIIKTCSEHLTVAALNTSQKNQRNLLGGSSLTASFLAFYFLIQLVLPLRTLAYPGPAAWGEEGYRFGWRVMLVEKAGNATFTVTDKATGRRAEVNNQDYLTPYQEKQMAIQPDFILQFAKHVATDFETRHLFVDPIVNVESFVALNGRRSRRLINLNSDLAAEENGLSPKPWILPFER